MSRTVFILGAGASQAAGGPLMSNFLDIAETVQRESPPSSDFKMVFEAIEALKATHSKSRLDLNNIESVFAAFEMAALFGRPLGGLNPGEVDQLGIAIRRLIVQTLEAKIQFPKGGKQIKPPVPYEQFVSLVRAMNKNNSNLVTVITFNYDIALDYAFHFGNLHCDYCLQSEIQPVGTPLLKLHGSINWADCQKCDRVIPWRLGEYLQRYESLPAFADASPYANIKIASHLKTCSQCNNVVPKDPVIIPPTWNKAKYHSKIAEVWKKAALELSDAENIFVIGYSLPDTDHFFRLLYAIGTVGPARIKQFWVFDPDTNSVGPRFKKLLGQAALGRFRTFNDPFSTAIIRIREEKELFPTWG